MPLIKMATAARRARMGSTNTVRRALVAAGIPLVTLAPGVFAVEEQDLQRFLATPRPEPAPAPRPKPPTEPNPAGAPGSKPKSRTRRQ